MMLLLFFCSCIIFANSEWNQLWNEPQLNSFVNSEFGKKEWIVNLTGSIVGGPIIDSERNTFVYLFFDTSGGEEAEQEVIVEVDIETGKVLTFQEVCKYPESSVDEGYGGLLSKKGQFVWMYEGGWDSVLKGFDMKEKKIIEGWSISNISVENGLMYYVLKDDNVIYLNRPFVCDESSDSQNCNKMTSVKIGSDTPDWISENIRCDSRLCSMTLSNDKIYIMNDINDITNPKSNILGKNEISIFDTATGKKISQVSLDPPIFDYSKKISVIPNEYYYFMTYKVIPGEMKVKLIIWAYSVNNNKLSWKYDVPNQFDFPGCAGSPIVISPDGEYVGLVCINDTKNYIYILDSKTGNLKTSGIIKEKIEDLRICFHLQFMKNGKLLISCRGFQSISLLLLDHSASKILDNIVVKGDGAEPSGLPIHDGSGNVFWCWSNYASHEWKTVTSCMKKYYG